MCDDWIGEMWSVLDADSDGLLAREDLRRVALEQAWGWPESSLYAVLDRLLIEGPLCADTFRELLQTASGDPLGVLGRVLTRLGEVHGWRGAPPAAPDLDPSDRAWPQEGLSEGLLQLLAGRSNEGAEYAALLRSLGPPPSTIGGPSALLVIDPQRSFTGGVWARSLGDEQEVEPIRIAFRHCARLVRNRAPDSHTMMSRCPFPADSYGWDEGIASVLPPDQAYFIKPGNNILWPPGNGFERWILGLLGKGVHRLMICGCTLNSCVRVSAIACLERFGAAGLQVLVPLSCCGARLANYRASAAYGGLSSVAAAVRQMLDVGVLVRPGPPATAQAGRSGQSSENGQ